MTDFSEETESLLNLLVYSLDKYSVLKEPIKRLNVEDKQQLLMGNLKLELNQLLKPTFRLLLKKLQLLAPLISSYLDKPEKHYILQALMVSSLDLKALRQESKEIQENKLAGEIRFASNKHKQDLLEFLADPIDSYAESSENQSEGTTWTSPFEESKSQSSVKINSCQNLQPFALNIKEIQNETALKVSRIDKNQNSFNAREDLNRKKLRENANAPHELEQEEEEEKKETLPRNIIEIVPNHNSQFYSENLSESFPQFGYPEPEQGKQEPITKILIADTKLGPKFIENINKGKPLKRKPEDEIADTYLREAIHLTDGESWAQALEGVNKSLKIEQSYDAYLIRGLAFENLGDEKAALDDYKTYTKHAEENWQRLCGYQCIRKILLKLREFRELIKIADLSIALVPADLEAWICKGKALYELNRFRDGEKCFEKVVQIDPTCSEGYIGKGQCLFRLEKVLQAIQEYDKAIKLCRNENLNPYFHKYEALNALAKQHEAIDCLKQAYRVVPHNDVIYQQQQSLPSFFNVNSEHIPNVEIEDDTLDFGI